MSYNIALSGLQATTQDLNTISNNISNASTVGFRGGRSEFAAIYNGGQAGGVNVMSTTQNFSTGGTLSYTGRELDLGIQGDGFFVLSGQDGSTLYARAGMFNQDANGFVVDPAGNRLQGYPVNTAKQLQNGTISDLQIQSGSLAANPTTAVGIVSNWDSTVDAIDLTVTPFDAADATTYHSTTTVTVNDSLGAEHALTEYHIKTADNAWTVNYMMDGELVDTNNLTFNNDGTLNTGAAKTLNITSTTNPAIIAGVDDLTIALSYTNTTQYAKDYNNSGLSQNGYTSGELNGIRLDENGMLYGTYTNGQEQLQGQVVLADFNNPNGLTPVSNNAWTATNQAGQAVMGSPTTGTLGGISSGYLEGSNVDTTAEMVSLMTAQRNYQSNAKVLDANSTMQQALLNAI
ncbi:flagellar hook protein FlgE [Shewanella surugensis]|uniref:Flagellar hook protein FlgE n=1 Tax=Shewanella surugensis TaxID=212020 RepID=A0ABT0LAQ4_9GAMM|nr:flagellar hook protein FlgE [Shewanella surugensis]MCL1124786.1 flagellar basal body protein FlgE [Shewanella surugensis]